MDMKGSEASQYKSISIKTEIYNICPLNIFAHLLLTYERGDLINLSIESFNNKEVLELRNSFTEQLGLTQISFWVLHTVRSTSPVTRYKQRRRVTVFWQNKDGNSK